MARADGEDDDQSDGERCSPMASFAADATDDAAPSEEFKALLKELVKQVSEAHKCEIAAVRHNLELRMSPSFEAVEPIQCVAMPSVVPCRSPHAPRTAPPRLRSPRHSPDCSQPVCAPASAFLPGFDEGQEELLMRSAKSKKSQNSAMINRSVFSAPSVDGCAMQVSSTEDSEGHPADVREPRWQWMHRTGWRNYQKHESDKIERAYQAGETKARLKSGKQGTHPMEIFFRDMLQHDNSTDMVRGIRRLGPNPWWQQASRYLWSLYREVETGVPREQSFISYRESSKISATSSAEFVDLKRKITRTVSVLVQKQKRLCKRITSSFTFSVFTMLLVAANTFWIGHEFNQTELVRQECMEFTVMNQLFCTLFFLEITLRFSAFDKKTHCLRNKWFLVDSVCTFSMILETWIIPLLVSLDIMDGLNTVNLGVIRALRLFRITRMARLAKAIPEFVTMIKGIVTALRSVVVTLIMLLSCLYLFGIIFRSQVESGSELEERYFGSIEHSMWTLLFHGTLLDAVSIVAEDIWAESAFLATMFMLSIFVTSFTVLNMLIGIIVGVVTAVKFDESERKAKKQLRKQLKDIMDVYDSDDTKTLNRAEFSLFIANPDVQRVLREYEVDTWGLINLADHLFDEDSQAILSFEQILDVVVRLRGDNRIRMADVVQLRKFTEQRLECMRAALTKDFDRAEPKRKADRLRARFGSSEGGGEETGSVQDPASLPGTPVPTGEVIEAEQLACTKPA